MKRSPLPGPDQRAPPVSPPSVDLDLLTPLPRAVSLPSSFFSFESFLEVALHSMSGVLPKCRRL